MVFWIVGKKVSIPCVGSFVLRMRAGTEGLYSIVPNPCGFFLKNGALQHPTGAVTVLKQVMYYP